MPDPAPVTIATLSWRTCDMFHLLSRAKQLEADLRAQAERVAELDVEVRERLDEAGVAQRAGVDRVEADLVGELADRLLRSVVVGRDQSAQALLAEAPGVHVLGEHRV